MQPRGFTATTTYAEVFSSKMLNATFFVPLVSTSWSGLATTAERFFVGSGPHAVLTVYRLPVPKLRFKNVGINNHLSLRDIRRSFCAYLGTPNVK